MPTLGTKNNGIPILGKLEETNFFDVKKWQSQYGANMLMGQGVLINSDNEGIKKYLNKIIKLNKLDDLLLQAAYDVNYGGRVVLTIDKPINGDFIISYANNELLQNVMKFEATEFGARLLKRKVIGQRVFFINETWTTTKVIRSLSIQDQTTKLARDITATDGELPPELNIPQIEEHNLGFVPFVEHTNKPSRNKLVTNQDTYQELQDDYAVRNLAIHINNGLIQWFKEEILGKTRVYGSFSEQARAKLKAKGNNALIEDLVIDTNPTPNQSKPVEVAQSTYQSAPWSDAVKAKINLYFIGCGYSAPFPDSTNPTEAETLFSKDNDTRTTKAKRRRWQITLKELFAKLLVYQGLSTDVDTALNEFSLEIKENVVYNQLQLVDFLLQAIDGGLMTRAEAIAQMRDLDEIKEAEEILTNIEQDQEAVAKTSMNRDTAALEAINNVTDPANTGAMAKGKDADPKGDK